MGHGGSREVSRHHGGVLQRRRRRPSRLRHSQTPDVRERRAMVT